MAKRGPYEKGEAKRSEILHAALEIFAAEGYRGTSLRKVAAQCNLSLPGLMHYFDSKEDLLTQVLRMRDETARVRQDERSSPESYREIIRESARTPGLVELFVSMAAAASDTAHPAHAHFAERYPVLRERVATYVRERMDEGRMTTVVPPERLAVLLLAVADGIQLQWLIDRSTDMEQPIDDIMRLLAPDREG
ncbi:putative transcriptional regulator [Streptomyces ambofaciens ATCC 23877]|uniref:Putative transcriptional regulator n=1 Tax=Streptomyces ambofaciens (strain ATCC 23877 / 3486 / DSM 40053 / JCM 4204 / NBRC 12836 / NRRL B-2516) TaxID=278992 RepID=A0ACM8_STRA7|nr:TetR/AcrR family transcriptional regulator [Streptomyces ambofaciens]AKZ60110.1 putative transcriptional regulator [Streptomyces ambofaciens ATCC 23877]CAJ88233.1 putative transcriptional regulator [Streptomyces ambofaciens ATCC 23877]